MASSGRCHAAHQTVRTAACPPVFAHRPEANNSQLFNMVLGRQVWRLEQQGRGVPQHQPADHQQARGVPGQPHGEGVHQQEVQVAAQGARLGAGARGRAHHPLQRRLRVQAIRHAGR